MSALTKIFVVLLVILSLLLSAATIVFVNTQTTTAADLTKQTTALKAAQVELARSNANHDAQLAMLQASLTDRDNQINQGRNDLAAMQQQVAQRDAANAELTANLAAATAAQTTLADGLKTAQVSLADRAKAYDDLRASADKIQKQLFDLNLRVDDLTNVADVRGLSLKVANEQIAQLQQDLGKANTVIQRNGLPPVTTDAGNAVNPDPGINVTAQVSETRDIAGVRYATINVGSADLVQKNMQLAIVDARSNQFLGYIKVDQVLPHEAYGRVDGPNASRVQQGAIVRSRL